MPTPDFVLELRRHVGTLPLPLVGVTAVVRRGDEVLLGRRSDNGRLTPITGIVDPGEEPADAAVREAAEEAGVEIVVDRLAWVYQIPRVTYDNGDRSDYLDLVFECRWLVGEPTPIDGEMTDLGWYAVSRIDEVLDAEMAARVRAGLTPGAARFEGGKAPSPVDGR